MDANEHESWYGTQATADYPPSRGYCGRARMTRMFRRMTNEEAQMSNPCNSGNPWLSRSDLTIQRFNVLTRRSHSPEFVVRNGVDVTIKPRNDRFVVTRAQIEKAIERNRPFVLKMADGNEYKVPHRDFIALPPNAAYVVVFDAEGKSFDVLPLLTMTGLHQSGDGIEGHYAD